MPLLPKLRGIGEIRDVFTAIIVRSHLFGLHESGDQLKYGDSGAKPIRHIFAALKHVEGLSQVTCFCLKVLEISRHLKNKWFRRVRSRPNHNPKDVETRAIETVCL